MPSWSTASMISATRYLCTSTWFLVRSPGTSRYVSSAFTSSVVITPPLSQAPHGAQQFHLHPRLSIPAHDLLRQRTSRPVDVDQDPKPRVGISVEQVIAN